MLRASLVWKEYMGSTDHTPFQKVKEPMDGGIGFVTVTR